MFSEQDIQAYIMEGKPMPIDFESKKQEINEGLLAEEFQSFAKVAALLESLNCSGQISNDIYYNKRSGLIDLAVIKNEEFYASLLYILRGIRMSSALWQAAGLDDQSFNLGQQYLNGELSLPGYEEIKLANENQLQDLIILPNSRDLYKDLFDFLKKDFGMSFKLPRGLYQFRKPFYGGYVIATSAFSKPGLTDLEQKLHGSPNLQRTTIEDLSNQIQEKNPNCYLSGLNLDEYMAMVVMKYLELKRVQPSMSREHIIHEMIDGESLSFILDLGQSNSALLSKGNEEGYEFVFSQLARGPIGRVKMTFDEKGLIKGGK